MSQPGFFGRLLGAFSRKPSAQPVPMPIEPPVAPAAAPVPTVPLHPIATRTAEPDGSTAPIVVPPRAPSAAPAMPQRAPAEAASAEPVVVPAAVTAFVEQVKQLPLFSATAMQLMRSVGEEDVSTAELARLISTDAALVAQLLRIVNSPYYGLPQRCATVVDAISVLGIAQVRRTVSAAVTKRPLATYLRDSRVVTAFWRHQLLCASLARHLANVRGLDGELAYMAGLMHEVGRLALLIQHPHLTELLLNVEGDHLGTRHETGHFGFDHAQVGGALLARWGLPAPIVQATFDHESETQPADPQSAVVWRANLLAHDVMHEPDVVDVQLPWMVAIDLSVAERRRILDEIAALESGQG